MNKRSILIPEPQTGRRGTLSVFDAIGFDSDQHSNKMCPVQWESKQDKVGHFKCPGWDFQSFIADPKLTIERK